MQHKYPRLVRHTKKSKVYCGRAQGGVIAPPGQHGWLGNPIVPGKKCLVCEGTHHGPGSTLECYRKYLWYKLKNDSAFRAEFEKLVGQEDNLYCFCMDKGLTETCHTNIIRNAILWIATQKEE